MAKFLPFVTLLYSATLCLSRTLLEDEPHQQASDFQVNIPGNLSGSSNNISTTSTLGICHGTSTIRSPCTVTSDSIYGGLYVDCSSLGLTSLDPRWFLTNTTTLILDRNNLTIIEDNTFACLTHLRKLSLTSCALSNFSADALQGLSNLEYLGLEDNSLPLLENEFLQAILRHTPGLRHLMMRLNNFNVDNCQSPQNSDLTNEKNSNGIYRRDKTIYSNKSKEIESVPCINISFLTHLESLSVDVFGELYFGEEFSHFQNLNTLILHTVYTTIIRNQSFYGLRNASIRELNIEGDENSGVYYLDPDAFQYFYNLTVLKLQHLKVGNHDITKSLRPFVHKNMTTIYLSNLKKSSFWFTPSGAKNDYVLTKDTLQYVVHICVSHLVWRNSRIATIDLTSFFGTASIKCLKSLDLNGNKIESFGYRTSWFLLSNFISLETLEIMNKPILYIPAYTDARVSEVALLQNKNMGGQYTNQVTPQSSIPNNCVSEPESSEITGLENTAKYSVDSHTQNVTSVNIFSSANQNRTLSAGRTFNLKSDGREKFSFVLPTVLCRLKFNAISSRNFISLKRKNFVILKGEKLQEMSLTEMDNLFYGDGRMLGLQNLRILDFSYSGVRVKDYFYDDFPNLEVLALRSMLPDYYFDKVIPCQRLVQNLQRLKYLDISKNSISSLTRDTFAQNPYLTFLNLSENRFSSLILDLKWTPKLTVLDLTHNSISTFSEDEMNAIDAHAQKVGTFYLKLSGNFLSCVCSEINFLAWLQRTEAILDNNGNYSCTNEDGTVTSTAALSDLLVFWRQCQGRLWFLLSLVLASMMTALLLAVITVNRFSRYVVAFLWRVLHDTFRPPISKDYRYDVFIGYVDKDCQFVKDQLNVFLENNLQKRTYIHQRDLGPGPLHEQLCGAIADSWRVLMVITRNFLNDQDMAANIVQYSISSESWQNQGRIFVLVEESIRHAIPTSLHNLLDDSRIIVISDLNDDQPQPLDYQQIQSINNCFLPLVQQ